jgi:hypothetical protein
LISDRSKELGGNILERLRAWAERVQLGEKAKFAALILVGIILVPYLIRTVFYYVLAPVAERRPPVRLLESRQAAGALTTSGPSATSLSLRLKPGEELLIRQGFLQSSSKGGTKATRWLLDYRHPLSSLAAGLSFLTRIRGGSEDLTTVSAVEDPFAEVSARLGRSRSLQGQESRRSFASSFLRRRPPTVATSNVVRREQA